MSYYAGDAWGYRGDYYQGDYYQGDAWGARLLKGARGLVARTPIGAVATTAAALIPSRRAPSQSFGALNPANANPNIQAPEPGISGIVHRLVPGGSTGYMAPARRTHPNKSTYVTRGGCSSKWPHKCMVHPKGSTLVTSRHMNPGNARALRRALTRAYAFERLAMRTIRLLHPRKHGSFGGFKRKRARK